MNSPPTSPMSGPPSPQLKKPIPKGFRSPPKPKQRPIASMSVKELRELHQKNLTILQSPAASTSIQVHRITAEQAAIEAQLVELVGMEDIRIGLKQTVIKGEDDMDLDIPVESPAVHMLSAKQRALARYGPANGLVRGIGTMSFQEAASIEQRAHALDVERRQKAEERRRRLGLPIKGEVLTRQEREARIWAFMNHKPTESDLEDDDSDGSDDDPAGWFHDSDDEDRNQNIVEPDIEDFSDIIRVDANRAAYSTFYEPQDDD